MKFHHIDIDGFGVLSDTTLDGLNGQLNVVYGPNGAGKSTLLHFLQGVFCGYDEGRRLGLMPPVGGGASGGSVHADWSGEACRFARSGDNGADQRLRITLDRDGRHTPHPRASKNVVPTALIPMLYTVGHADVHALDRLVERAIDDGIELIARNGNPDDLTSAASTVHAQRAELVDETRRGRVAELTESRHQLQSELERLTRQLRERCDELTRDHHARQQSARRHALQTVQWLHDELQAVETDLREAEDLAWRPIPTRTRTETVTVNRPSTRRFASTRHVDVDRRAELEDIDRRITDARTRLIEIAEARLEINLGAARIAGSEDLQAGQLLTRLRESLSELEGTMLELRDDAHDLSNQQSPRGCMCNKWATTTQTSVQEMRRRLYGICQDVARFELHHNKMFYSAAAEQLDREELEQLQLVKSLREERQAIVDSTGRLETWHGPSQHCVEHDLCDCSEHWEYERAQSDPQPVPVTETTIVVERNVPAATIVKPTAEELRRLRRRCAELQSQLESARQQWRASRHQTIPFELPDDVRALEEQVDQTRVDLDTVERELTSSQEQWNVLSVTGEVIRRAVERVQKDTRPQVIRWVGEYLSRLTGGRYVGIRVTPEHHDLRVIDSGDNERPRWTLSRGTLDQVALSLRLALVRAYAERGVQFPIVFDDVLVDCDIDRLHEAVRLLSEFAQKHDQQIIYLTCGTHLASLFQSEGTSPVSMPGSLSGSWRRPETVERPANWTIRGWVDQPHHPTEIIEEAHIVRVPERVQPALAAKKVERVETTETTHTRHVTSTGSSDRVRLARPLNRRQPGGQYWLSMDSPITLVPSIGKQMGHRLVALGIRNVADLVDLPADEETVPLNTLQISESRLREWQAEGLLLCCVPDLTGVDAQMLVVCGIRSVRQLAEIDVDQLWTSVSRLPRDRWERDRREGWPSREIVGRWIHNGRLARSREDARRDSSRRMSSTRSSTSQRDGSKRTGHGSRTTVARTRYTHGDRSHHSEREPREERAVITPFTSVSKQPQTDQSTEWKFYLNMDSPVVDAPSIGPKMALRLEKLGIINVSDLLNRQASDIARKLDHKRVKEETVLVWQQQARLMCRIPQLRGHDAQVLVACDITQPEQVAGMDPRALFGIVGPFVETVDGQRLLRSSKTPDLEEVTDWINWANHARSLKAA
ncbi:MAG: DUF4332 domain-containing protein [Planctomycetaceae bacterium]|nr:DUF4332 domain-containing protein [Planctomycetaceae bacterium]